MSARYVLISQRCVVDATTGEVRDALDRRWVTFLAHAGFIGVPVPNGGDVEALAAAVNPAGVVLTGGGDVGDDPLRDATERELIARGTPVIGVCRGAQHLVVLDGGTLIDVSGHVRTRHRLVVDEQARLFAAHADKTVSSFHARAPRARTRTLRPSAYDETGVIEALESDDGRRAALLWHPEREDAPGDADVMLFRRVFS